VGDGGEFRAPMAIGVIGGLLVSTVLSLVFVPSFYSIMDSISRVVSRFFSRFVGPKEEDEDEQVPGHGLPPTLPERKTPLKLAAE